MPPELSPTDRHIEATLAQAGMLAASIGPNPDQLEMLAEMVARSFHGVEATAALKMLILDWLQSEVSAEVRDVTAQALSATMARTGPADQMPSGRVIPIVDATAPGELHTIVWNGGRHPGDWHVTYGFAADGPAKAWGQEFLSAQGLTWYYAKGELVEPVVQPF